MSYMNKHQIMNKTGKTNALIDTTFQQPSLGNYAVSHMRLD